jgi:tetratricopeptide (TPR) repeat protein
MACAVLALIFGFWFWHHRPRLQPPIPDLTGVDPEVVEAITEAHQAVLKKPSSGRAWGHLGMILSAHGFPREANRCLVEAERLEPHEPRWPYLQGVGLVLTDTESGIACFQRAVDHGGDVSLVPRLRLAEALLDQGQFDAADRHLRQVLEVEPDNVRARFALGRLARLREDWPQALEQLAACGANPHTRKLAHTVSAQVHRRLGERQQAEADEKQAEKLPDDEGWPDPYMEEVEQLQRGLQARIRQTEALTKAGQTEQAIQLLEKTAARYPKSGQVWLGLGGMWFQRGRLDQAEQCFHQAIQVEPDAPEAWFRLGCLQAVDRPREAADSFRRVIRLRPDHTLAHFNLGHRLKQLGDSAGAADAFRAALRCRPDFQPARDALKELERPAGAR